MHVGGWGLQKGVLSNMLECAEAAIEGEGVPGSGVSIVCLSSVFCRSGSCGEEELLSGRHGTTSQSDDHYSGSQSQLRPLIHNVHPWLPDKLPLSAAPIAQNSNSFRANNRN